MLVDGSKREFQIPAHPAFRHLFRATKPEYAAERMPLFIPVAGHRHGGPFGVVQLRAGPSSSQTEIAQILRRVRSLPLLECLIRDLVIGSPGKRFIEAHLLTPCGIAHQGFPAEPCLHAGTSPRIANQPHRNSESTVDLPAKIAAHR